MKEIKLPKCNMAAEEDDLQKKREALRRKLTLHEEICVGNADGRLGSQSNDNLTGFIQFDDIKLIVGCKVFFFDDLGTFLHSGKEFETKFGKWRLEEVLFLIEHVLRQMILYHDIKSNPMHFSKEEFDEKTKCLRDQSYSLFQEVYEGKARIWHEIGLQIGNVEIGLLQVGSFLENTSQHLYKDGAEYGFNDVICSIHTRIKKELYNYLEYAHSRAKIAIPQGYID